MPEPFPSPPGCVPSGVTDRPEILQNIQRAIGGRFPLYSLGFGQDLDFNFLKSLSMENNGWAQRIYEGHDAAQQLQVSVLPSPCPGPPTEGRREPLVGVAAYLAA